MGLKLLGDNLTEVKSKNRILLGLDFELSFLDHNKNFRSIGPLLVSLNISPGIVFLSSS